MCVYMYVCVHIVCLFVCAYIYMDAHASVCVCVNMCMCMHAHTWVQAVKETGRRRGIPWSWSCEMPDVIAENQTPDLWEGSKCSYRLSHLSSASCVLLIWPRILFLNVAKYFTYILYICFRPRNRPFHETLGNWCWGYSRMTVTISASGRSISLGLFTGQGWKMFEDEVLLGAGWCLSTPETEAGGSMRVRDHSGIHSDVQVSLGYIQHETASKSSAPSDELKLGLENSDLPVCGFSPPVSCDSRE